MNRQFYVYVQCRPSGEPFYIGKGHGDRAYQFKRKHNNKHYHNIVQKHGMENCSVYVRKCRDEAQAFKHEIWMIAYGRAQGWRLTNMTDGGDGSCGYKHTAKTRAILRTLFDNPEYRANHSAKMSAAKLGSKASLITRNRMAASGKSWHKDPKRNASWKASMSSQDFSSKISASLMGNIPWNKGKKGVQVAWNRGKKMTLEFCENQSAISKKSWAIPEYREKMVTIRRSQKGTVAYRSMVGSV
jgi:hypothetical protein